MIREAIKRRIGNFVYLLLCLMLLGIATSCGDKDVVSITRPISNNPSDNDSNPKENTSEPNINYKLYGDWVDNTKKYIEWSKFDFFPDDFDKQKRTCSETTGWVYIEGYSITENFGNGPVTRDYPGKTANYIINGKQLILTFTDEVNKGKTLTLEFALDGDKLTLFFSDKTIELERNV